MVAADVIDLEVRRGDLRLRVHRDPRDFPRSASSGNEARSGTPAGSGHHRVVAPLTGVFYASQNPTSKPYVAVGDLVERDTVIGLIETMKVFSEVTADCRGRVVAILAHQGQLIHGGEAILTVDIGAVSDNSHEAIS